MTKMSDRLGGLPANVVTRADNLPDWWAARGNTLMAHPETPLPHLVAHPGVEPPAGAVVVLAYGATVRSIMLWGLRPAVSIGEHTVLPNGHIACGGDSTVVLGDRISCMDSPTINARNGGTVRVGSHGLWSSEVMIYTDDMHAIVDRDTGARLNAYGGTVTIADHVWLGFQAMLLPGANIGRDSVIGARAVVTGELPPNTVSVGAPAKVVRSNVNWSLEDIAP